MDLDARKGVNVVLGPNGAGKTTLLNLISGLDTPDRGTIRMHGRDLGNVPVEERGIGYIFQVDTLFPHLDVERNIRFGIKGGPADGKRFKRMVKLMGIGKILDRKVASLSQGQRQRVSIARTLVTDPDVLLLDEPLSRLDRPFRLDLRRELSKLLRDLDKVVIYVTHSRDDVHHLADKLSIMEDGRIVQSGVPKEVLDVPRSVFTARFSGYQNVLDANVLKDDGGLVDLEAHGVRLTGISDGGSEGSVKLVLRPEDIVISMAPVVGSPRNSIKGNVVGLVQKGPLTEVVFEGPGGIELNALITRRSAEELALEKGSMIWATFKTVAARVIKG
jgi:molybdopterin-binding protein